MENVPLRHGTIETFREEETIVYIATYSIDIAALIFMIWLLFTSTSLDSGRKKPFLAAAILTILIILSEIGTVFAGGGDPALRYINIVCNVLGFALTPAIPIAIFLILDRRPLRKQLFLLAPTLMNGVAVILSPLYGFIFFVDAGNRYFRGEYYFIFIAVYIINFSLLIIRTVKVCNRHNYPILWKAIGLFMFTVIGTSIQLVFPLAYSSWHCVTLSLFLYYFLLSEFDSSFDTLTGLYNRANFDRVSTQVAGLKPFSVIIMDINDFKSINDTFGHDYGDAVLEAVAAVIRETFKKGYTCFRYGGDEFVVTGKEAAQEKIESQLTNLAKTLLESSVRGNPLPALSYGYSIFPGGEPPDFNTHLKEADERMYRFKKACKKDSVF